MSKTVIRVLLVEDNPGDARLIQELLKHNPHTQFELEVVDRLAEACERLSNDGSIDVVLLDLSLPDSQGLDTLMTLQSATSDVPIVVQTGLHDDELGLEAVSKGAQDYLVKGQADHKLLVRSLQYAVERKQAEVSLRRERDKTQQYLDVAGVIILALDAEGRITLINKKGCAVFGYTEAELIGKNWFEISLPNEAKQAREKAGFGMIIAGTVTSYPYYENIVVTRSGEERIIAWHNTVLTDEAGTIIGTLSSGEDITERREAEKSLHETNERVQALIQASPMAINILDSDFCVQLWNPASERIFGWTAEEVLGGPLPFIPDDSDRRERFLKIAGEVFDGQTFSDMTVHARCKDDSLIDISLAVAPVRDADGNIVGAMGIQDDITERIQTEKKLAAERNLLRTLIDNVPDYIFIKDRQGRFTISNTAHASAAGLKPGDLIGKMASDVFHSDVAPQFHEDDEQVMQSGEPLINQERITTRPDGSKKWVLTTKVPLRDEQNQVISLVGMSRDITAQKQAQEALEVERNLLHALMDNIPDLIYFKDRQSRFIRINEAEARFLGAASPEEALGKTDFDYMPEETAPAIFAAEQEMMRSGIPILNQIELHHSQGKPEQWIVSNKVPLRDATGQITGMVGVSRDFTEQKRAEQAVRESEERFRILFEHSPDAILLIDPHNPNVSWPIVDCNQVFCDLNGFKYTELIGQSIDIVHGEPDDPKARTAYMERLRKEGTFSIETVHTRKDGSIINISVSTSLVTLNGQELVLGIDRDITERLQAEQALRESEIRFRAMNEASPVGIFLTNSDGKFIYSNQMYQQLTKLTFEETLGDGWIAPLHPEDREQVCEAWQQCIAEKKPLFESSHRLLVKDVIVWVSVKAVPIAVDETLSGYLGAVEDVTEQVEAERRKLELALEREKVDMLESFITNASHDLRTPLTIISTGVSLLEKTVEPEKRQKRLQKINTQIERVRWLLDEMLTMSWLDNTELTFDPRPCDLNALVESILSDQSLLAEMKQLTVQFEAADVPPLRANQGVLRRALSNIVINAVDYTPEGGTITVTTCVEDGRVGIIVRDTGDGIADKDLPHIFERFYRADQARSLEKGGMGLGLSIAQKIISAHNGSIQVETTVGAGSVFTVWLPVNTS